jgi:hypothetical protein
MLIKLYEVIAVPVLVYGSENLALHKSESREIKTAEMRFLGEVPDYTLTDHARNTIHNALWICPVGERV